MKEYPSIERYSDKFSGRVGYGFYKVDGSNLRWEWSKKRGWFKFGTRTRLFDHTDDVFGEAIPIFEKNLAEKLERILVNKYKTDNAIVFTEFFGENSFAGTHVKTDKKQLIVIDVNIHKKGIVSPKEFLKVFGNDGDVLTAEIPTPRLVYHGVINHDIVTQIRTKEFPNLNEGVVFKGGEGHSLWMTKVKTDEYIAKLKEVFKLEWKKYE